MAEHQPEHGGLVSDAAEMVNRCFRHQHPEAYGRGEIGEAILPPELRYGLEDAILPTPAIPEMQTGDPDAIPLL